LFFDCSCNEGASDESEISISSIFFALIDLDEAEEVESLDFDFGAAAGEEDDFFEGFEAREMSIDESESRRASR
jgi:hypothetical protein